MTDPYSRHETTMWRLLTCIMVALAVAAVVTALTGCMTPQQREDVGRGIGTGLAQAGQALVEGMKKANGT